VDFAKYGVVLAQLRPLVVLDPLLNYNEPMNTRALKEGEDVAKKSILYLVMLGSLKMFAGLVTGMTIMFAGAISTFADIIGIAASYFGLHLSRKSANEHFKYGYYKIETVAAFLVSLGIIYLGVKIMGEGIEILRSPETGKLYVFAIITTILAISHSRKLAVKFQEAADKTNSLSLLANARDKKMDVFAESAVLLSIGANYLQIPYVEGGMTIIIGLFILKTGLFSTKDALYFLLDYWDDPILTRKIKKVFRAEKDFILGIKKLRLRRAGNFIFGEAFVEINPFAGIQDLRVELDIIQSKIKELNPYIKDFSIFTHITKSDKMKVAIPIKEDQRLSSRIAPTQKKTTAYLFAEIRKNKIGKVYVRKLKDKDREPLALGEFLKKEKINILIDNKLNSIMYFNLRRTHHILIYPRFSGVPTAKKALELLMIDT